MPIYSYTCLKCGKSFEKVLSVKDWKQRIKCSCGKMANHNIIADHKDGGADALMRENHRWSISMGVPAHQVEQFRERYPDSTYRNDGALLVKNRVDKLRQAKERDMTELT